MTFPYRESTPDLIRQAHEQRVRLTLSNGTTTWTVEPLTGTLTLAEDWSPFAQLRSTIANTFLPGELSLIDPRTDLDVVLEAGYIHPDGAVDLHPVFTGQLEERKARNPSGVVDLQASGAEVFAHEAKWMDADTWKTFAGVTEAVAWLAGYALGGTAPAVLSTLGNLYRPDLVNAVPLVTGQDIWEAIGDIALAANVRVFVDVDGTWTIAPRATLAGVTAAYLSTGGGGIVDSSEDVLTRQDYHGAAAVKFEWRDAGGIDRQVIGKYGASGTKTYSETRKYPVNQTQADGVAQAIVRNQSTRGDSYQCNGVAVWWLRPGDTVQVSLANGTEARHIVRRIVFDFMSGTMQVTTREPSNLGA